VPPHLCDAPSERREEHPNENRDEERLEEAFPRRLRIHNRFWRIVGDGTVVEDDMRVSAGRR
jgi:hypothetical protein